MNKQFFPFAFKWSVNEKKHKERRMMREGFFASERFFQGHELCVSFQSVCMGIIRNPLPV